MLRTGPNDIDGVPILVVRKRIRRINLRIGTDGVVRLSVPLRGATLSEGEAFLRAKWTWVTRVRAKVLDRAAVRCEPIAELDRLRLVLLLTDLNAKWSERLDERGVVWRIRPLRSLWGSCQWRKRVITYNLELARADDDLVEYVVVHEYTHFAVHNHGAAFQRLMDERLPDWRERRRRLNGYQSG